MIMEYSTIGMRFIESHLFMIFLHTLPEETNFTH